MGSFEKKIGETFLNLKIPFVDFGITRSDCIPLEGIFRNPEFPILSQNRNQLFRMASMTKPITAYLTLAALADNAIDLHESVGNYVPEINDLKIAYKEGGVIKYKKNDIFSVSKISFSSFLIDFGGTTAKRTSKSDSASNFTPDTVFPRSVRLKIVQKR